MKRILFVCTGNTCRSPMAEALFRRMAGEAGIDVEVRSAGVAASNGAPMSMNTRIVLQQKGIQDDIKSSLLDSEAVNWTDLILTMTMNHKGFVIERFPEAVHKVFTLKEYAIDNPDLIRVLEEHQKLMANMQVNLALNQPLDEKDQERLAELDKSIPNFDIADPIGGDIDVYMACAEEMEQALQRVVDKLRSADERDSGQAPD